MGEKMVDYQIVAIIPAAGTGQRMNAGVNKIWLSLAGRSILELVLEVFQETNTIDHVVLVVNAAEEREITHLIEQNSKLNPEKFTIIHGGKERQDSVAAGIGYYQNWSGWATPHRMVLIHDAARALVTSNILEDAILACRTYQAVGVATPVKDTIKQIDTAGYVVATPERSTLWAVQTPQVFDFNLISDCYKKVVALNRNFTDDCAVAEYCGHRVKLVMGSYENFKITTPEDLIVAEAIVRRRQDANRAGV
ncbi:MAG TPA: 2-C-methyl-D-erythritol 4-phosphate cytidylyltransferase [Firmicutes bacterium]|nr:2-C-methyl-D-erythritol 4-phosphate cytidylyltransferase [Bacillota bacterium]